MESHGVRRRLDRKLVTAEFDSQKIMVWWHNWLKGGWPMKFLLMDCWLHGGKVLDAEVEEREEHHWVGCLGHSIAVDTRDLPIYETHDLIAKTEGLNNKEKQQLLSRSKIAA
jgi:hypothetical protein